MPNAKLVEVLNVAMATESVAAILDDPGDLLERLSVPGSLVDVATGLLELDETQVSYLQSIPGVLQEAVRSAVLEAINQGKAIHFQYSPAYDFEVRLWDYGQAVSVHVSGPYGENTARTEYLASS